MWAVFDAGFTMRMGQPFIRWWLGLLSLVVASVRAKACVFGAGDGGAIGVACFLMTRRGARPVWSNAEMATLCVVTLWGRCCGAHGSLVRPQRGVRLILGLWCILCSAL